MQAEGNSDKVAVLDKVNRHIGIPHYDHSATWNNWQLTTYIEMHLISLYILQSAADGAGWHKRHLLMFFLLPFRIYFLNCLHAGALPADLTGFPGPLFLLNKLRLVRKDLRILKVSLEFWSLYNWHNFIPSTFVYFSFHCAKQFDFFKLKKMFGMDKELWFLSLIHS